MKGLILAAGMGTRLRPLTGRVSKPLLPLAGAPLISYPLRSLLQAGVHDIGIVAGDNLAELQHGLAAYDSAYGGPARLSYLHQPHAGGLAHAVACARDYCGGDDFVLLFCDNLYAAPLAPALEQWGQLRHRSSDGHEALIHTITVADPRAFGVAVLDDQRAVLHLEEKPAQPRSDQAVIGIDILTPQIFEAIGHIRPSARGELEITDALMQLVHGGHRVHARALPGWWFDTGTFSALLEALPPVMDELAATAHERICISPDATVEDCTFEPPVYIGAGCRLRGCRLGPYVSCEGDCSLENCRLEHCLVYPGAQLLHIHAARQVFGSGSFSYAADGS
jgi:glucose-1-phosphate thymidylyltransferase